MKRTFLPLALLPCLLLPTGCKVGPDYHVPKESLPIGWKQSPAQSAQAASTAPSLDKQALAELAWWKQFNDPILDMLIEKGLAQNYDLKIAEARIKEARASLTEARAALLPEVNAQATAERQANDIAFGKTTFPKPFNIFQAGFDASWELDLFGGSRRGLEAVEGLFGAAKAARDNIRISMLAEIARNYINIRRYQTQSEIANNATKAAQDQLDIENELLKVGSVPETDMIRAKTQHMQSQSQALYYQSLLTANEYALDLLLAEKPGTAHDLVTEARPIPAMDKQLLLSAPADVIANRPDIRVAERNLAAATAEIGVAKAKLFPEISLAGFFGLFNPVADNLVKAQSKSWSASGTIFWPVLNYGRLSAGITSAKAQKEEALLAYKKAVTAALVDVETSLSTYYKQEESRALLNKTAEADKRALDIADMRYKGGVSALTEVLQSRNVLYGAQLQAADADANSAQDVVAVYKSLGGGFRNPKLQQQADEKTRK